MKILYKTVVAAAMPLCIIAADLSSLPWIGDGRPERTGADWYEEDPAPEFCAEFVLPKGVTETSIHFTCAGFGYFRINGAYMSADGLDAFWSVYDKTVYSTTTHTLKACPVLNAGARMKGFELEPYPATNRVFVRLGNGFYNLPPLRFWGSKCFRENLAHGRPCFKLSIDGVDKPLEWKWRETNVLRNSVYLGTEVDATRPESLDWKLAAVVRGPKGKIVEWPRSNPQMGCYGIHHGGSRCTKAFQDGSTCSSAAQLRSGRHGRSRTTSIPTATRCSAPSMSGSSGSGRYGDQVRIVMPNVWLKCVLQKAWSAS